MADRLLVSTEVMQATVTKYNQAHQRMQEALKAMDNAWDQLNQVWDGTIKAAFMAQWVVIRGNIAKSNLAMEKSIRGLTGSIEKFQANEDERTQKAGSLNEGTVPPMF